MTEIYTENRSVIATTGGFTATESWNLLNFFTGSQSGKFHFHNLMETFHSTFHCFLPQLIDRQKNRKSDASVNNCSRAVMSLLLLCPKYPKEKLF